MLFLGKNQNGKEEPWQQRDGAGLLNQRAETPTMGMDVLPSGTHVPIRPLGGGQRATTTGMVRSNAVPPKL